MKIVSKYPPNYEIMQIVFNPRPETVFAYYPYIYNPSGQEVHQDIIRHEEVHLERQKIIGVETWYNRYISDPEFRLEEELLSYGKQAQFLRFLPYKIWIEAVNEFATSLVNDYKVNITIHEAESKIRNVAKGKHTVV